MVVYNVNWKQYTQKQFVKLQNELNKWLQSWKISQNQYNQARSEIEKAIYWVKQNEWQNNKKSPINQENTTVNNQITEPINTFWWDTTTDMSFNISPEEEANIKQVQQAYYEPYFNRVRWEYTQDYQSSVRDLNRLIEYTNTDYAKNLASENKAFARSLDKATNAYWQRGLLWSWIQKSQVWEATSDYEKSLQNMAEYRRRKTEWLETQWQNMKTKFDRWIRDIWETQQAQTYFDTIQEIQNRQNEFYRNLWVDQTKPEAFNITKPTTPNTWLYTPEELKNKNLLNK